MNNRGNKWKKRGKEEPKKHDENFPKNEEKNKETLLLFLFSFLLFSLFSEKQKTIFSFE